MGSSSKDAKSSSGKPRHRGKQRVEDSRRPAATDHENYNNNNNNNNNIPIPGPILHTQLAPTALREPSFSFLFVINNLEIDTDFFTPNRNRWGSMEPPLSQLAYTGEVASPVFRYQNGQVTQLDDEYYWWDRPGGNWGTSHAPGVVTGWKFNEALNEIRHHQLTAYQTYTIFRGWRFQPVIFMGNDATITDVDDDNADTMYHALTFGARSSQGNNNSNVSLAGERRSPYAAGRDADWVGRLVPETYTHPYPHAMRSGGLAGSLPLILGLMGLSQPHRRAADAFTQGLWHDRRWHGPRWSWRFENPTIDASPGPDDFPRGVVVHVCCDDIDNPLSSTTDHIRDFETRGIIVRDH